MTESRGGDSRVLDFVHDLHQPLCAAHLFVEQMMTRGTTDDTFQPLALKVSDCILEMRQLLAMLENTWRSAEHRG